MKNLRKLNGISNLEEFVNSQEYIEPSVCEVGGPDHVVYNYRKKMFKDLRFDKNDYLSIYALTNGIFSYTGASGAPIQYSKNGDEWVQFSSSVSCKKGDTINLRGTNSSYNGYVISYTGDWILYGNSDSLLNTNKDTNFTTGVEYSASVFRGLFQNNTSLISIADLKINANSQYACATMFKGCSKLIDVLDNLISESGKNCAFQEMFADCSSIQNSDNLTIAVNGDRCCSKMFQNCTNLRTCPKLNIESYGSYCFEYMFQNCINLVSPTQDLMANSKGYSFSHMFDGCSSLRTLPKFSGIPSSSEFAYAFYNCTSIKTIPENYFSDIQAPTSSPNQIFEYMFYGCTNLTTVLSLPNWSTLPTSACAYMFANCTNLKNVVSLCNWTVATSTYGHMFENCVNLENIIINANSYNYYDNYTRMFSGCSKLNKVISLRCYDESTNSSSINSQNWLANVSPTGTLYLLEGVELRSGSDGIPNGWTLKHIPFSAISDIEDSSGLNAESCPDPEEDDSVQFDWWNNLMLEGDNYAFVTESGTIYKLKRGVNTYSDYVYTGISYTKYGNADSNSNYSVLVSQRHYNTGENTYENNANLASLHPKLIIKNVHFLTSVE